MTVVISIWLLFGIVNVFLAKETREFPEKINPLTNPFSIIKLMVGPLGLFTFPMYIFYIKRWETKYEHYILGLKFITSFIRVRYYNLKKLSIEDVVFFDDDAFNVFIFTTPHPSENFDNILFEYTKASLLNYYYDDDFSRLVFVSLMCKALDLNFDIQNIEL